MLSIGFNEGMTMQNAAALTLTGSGSTISIGAVQAPVTADWEGRLRRLQRSKAASRALRAAPCVLALLASGAMTLALFRFWETLGAMGAWGYAGVFVAELANSASILIPLPAHNYALALSLSLNPLILGVAGGVGAGLGEITGYIVGRNGRKAVSENRLMKRFTGLIERRLGLALFVFSAIPAPFDFAGMVAGATKYPLHRFLLLVTAGKILKVTGIALLGYYGLSAIMPSFG